MTRLPIDMEYGFTVEFNGEKIQGECLLIGDEGESGILEVVGIEYYDDGEDSDGELVSPKTEAFRAMLEKLIRDNKEANEVFDVYRFEYLNDPDNY